MVLFYSPHSFVSASRWCAQLRRRCPVLLERRESHAQRNESRLTNEMLLRRLIKAQPVCRLIKGHAERRKERRGRNSFPRTPLTCVMCCSFFAQLSDKQRVKPSIENATPQGDLDCALLGNREQDTIDKPRDQVLSSFRPRVAKNEPIFDLFLFYSPRNSTGV